MTASVADSRQIDITRTASLLINVGQTWGTYHCIVVPVRYDAIVGIPWMVQNNASIDWDRRVLVTRFGEIPEYSAAPSLREGAGLEGSALAYIDVSPRDDMWAAMDLLYDLQQQTEVYNIDALETGPARATAPVHPAATALLEKYSDRLRDELPDDLPPRRPQDPRLELRADAELKNRPVYRMSATETAGLREILDKLLDRGQIYECDTAYASPAFIIKKKVGGYRLLVDMRQMNAAIKDYSWPIQNISSLLDRTHGCSIFSVFDMVSGYQQMRIHPDSEELTAFRCPLGVYAWRTLPQGCKVSPSAFCRLMQTVFKDMPFVCVYLDDLLVCSHSEEEHEQHLHAVFEALRVNTLYASRSKTKLYQTSVEYLGHVVDAAGVHVDPRKVAVIKEWPVPKSQKQVRQLLGTFGYYRRFILGYADLAAPLNRLLAKDVEFNWTPACDTALTELKRRMCSAPVLHPFDDNLETFLVTDASDQGIGAVLEQKHSDGRHPVEYMSRQLNDAQRRYPVQQKELLAIVESLKHWRHFIMGRAVIAETDHHPLRYLKTQGGLSTMLWSWIGLVESSGIQIVYKPGKDNQLADGLSRNPIWEIADVAVLNSDEQLRDQIRAGYPRDPAFKAVHHALLEPPPKVDKSLATKIKRYELVDGLLYYVADTHPRLCIPYTDDLRAEIIRRNHDTPTSGHLAVDATLARLRDFYWPRMNKTVEHFVGSCDRCQRVKDRTVSKNGLLQPHAVPPFPFHTISMDLITSLPKTKNNHDAMLVIVCKLTKFTYLLPLKERNSQAPVLAKLFLDTVFRHHGMPCVIVSDRDPRFTAAFWSELMALCGVRLNMTTARHAEGDGETERRNRTVEQVLRALVSRNQRTWDELLPYTEFAINSSKQAATGMSPMHVVFGHEPVLPNVLLNTLPGRVQPSLEGFMSSHAQVVRQARDSLAAAQDAMAAQVNRSRRDVHFKAGDDVLISANMIKTDYERGRESDKLSDRWVGPFKVIEALSDVTYRIKLPANIRAHNVFHISSLKAYIGRSNELSRPGPVDGTSDRYEVERIIGHRQHRGKTQYLAQWTGYAEGEAEYLNEDAFDDGMVQHYWDTCETS